MGLWEWMLSVILVGLVIAALVTGHWLHGIALAIVVCFIIWLFWYLGKSRGKKGGNGP